MPRGSSTSLIQFERRTCLALQKRHENACIQDIGDVVIRAAIRPTSRGNGTMLFRATTARLTMIAGTSSLG